MKDPQKSAQHSLKPQDNSHGIIGGGQSSHPQQHLSHHSVMPNDLKLNLGMGVGSNLGGMMGQMEKVNHELIKAVSKVNV